uniref:Uncharacterized protein n=1 Tax=viral metagenome TaxID=1070528 RepID=A0A6C0D4H1_9ZZZZ
MSAYCNSVFFGSRPVSIDELLPYMLIVSNKEKEMYNKVEIDTHEIIDETIEPTKNKEVIIETTQSETVQTEPILDIIVPKQQDTLFWCIYIAVFGYNDYLEVSRNYGVKELDIKKQIADFIQKTPTAFKNSNIKVTKVAIQEILSELLTSQKETSIMCLLAMIIKYHIHILLTDPTDRFYLEYYYDKDMDESPTYIIQKDTFGKYKVQLEPLSKEALAQWKSSRFALESYLKPLQAISLYKVSELEDIARRFELYNETKKYKKADLYNDICEAIRWR